MVHSQLSIVRYGEFRPKDDGEDGDGDIDNEDDVMIMMMVITMMMSVVKMTTMIMMVNERQIPSETVIYL